MPTIDRAWAREFAEEWIAAWNSHDLERIFAHYVDELTMRSPLIAARGFDATGVLRGKAAIRPYWSARLAATPPLRFELLDVYAGIDMIVIHYRSVAHRLVTEILELDAERRVISGAACHGPTVA